MVTNFEKFLISPGFIVSCWKSSRISNTYLKGAESNGRKPFWEVEGKRPLDLNRVKFFTMFCSSDFSSNFCETGPFGPISGNFDEN